LVHIEDRNQNKLSNSSTQRDTVNSGALSMSDGGNGVNAYSVGGSRNFKNPHEYSAQQRLYPEHYQRVNWTMNEHQGK
jgi:hypothetical protein